jgi:hypothetical protein
MSMIMWPAQLGRSFDQSFGFSGFAGPAQIAGAIEAISGAAGVKTK